MDYNNAKKDGTMNMPVGYRDLNAITCTEIIPEDKDVSGGPPETSLSAQHIKFEKHHLELREMRICQDQN